MIYELIDPKRTTSLKTTPDVVSKMVATLDDWRQSCRDSLAEKDY